MALSGMLGCDCVRSRRGELRRIVNALRAYRLVCVVVLGDVRQSDGRCHENEMSTGIEYKSNAHTFRRAKIRCRAIFTTYSHTYRHLEHTAKRRKRASPTRRRRRRRRHRNARRARARHQAAQRPCRTRRSASTTCHAGTGSSGPAADGHIDGRPLRADAREPRRLCARARALRGRARPLARRPSPTRSLRPSCARGARSPRPDATNERRKSTGERHHGTQNATGVARRG